jgi:hypothetical protein
VLKSNSDLRSPFNNCYKSPPPPIKFYNAFPNFSLFGLYSYTIFPLGFSCFKVGVNYITNIYYISDQLHQNVDHISIYNY